MKVEVAVLGSPSVPNKPTVSVDVKQHSTNQPVSLFLFSFPHWHVKGLSLKRIALKADVIEKYNKNKIL